VQRLPRLGLRDRQALAREPRPTADLPQSAELQYNRPPSAKRDWTTAGLS